MDDFKSQGKDFKITAMIITGGIFGIFLTVGQAWSFFLEEAILSILPENENIVFKQFLNAVSTSAIGVILGILLIRIDTCCGQIKEHTINTPVFSFRKTGSRPANRHVNVKAIIHARKSDRR